MIERDTYSEKDYEKDLGKFCYGRIRSYDHVKGFGFIETERRRRLFFSSWNFENKKTEKHIHLGDVVSFFVGKRNGKYCAQEIQIVEPFLLGRDYCLGENSVTHLWSLKRARLDEENTPPQHVAFEFRKASKEYRLGKDQILRTGLPVEEYYDLLAELCWMPYWSAGKVPRIPADETNGGLMVLVEMLGLKKYQEVNQNREGKRKNKADDTKKDEA